MEYNTVVQPNLIGPTMKNTVYKITKIKSNNTTISDKIANAMSDFYESYVKDNKVIALIVIGIVAFFVYRYYEKKQKEEEDEEKFKEQFSNQDYNTMRNIPMQTSHLRYDTQPTLNPLFSVDSQKEPVFYPPEPLPVNIPNKGMTYTRSLYGEPNSFTPMINTDDHNYNGVYSNDSRSYYTGTLNTYKNAKDTNIINPLGFPVDFNTTTGNFVGGMTNMNTQNVIDYQTVLDSMNQNLEDSLKVGPKYLGSGKPELSMDPPYAADF